MKMCSFLVAAFCVAMSPNCVATAQEAADDLKTIRRDAWSEYYAAQLPNYEFTLASSPDEPLQLPDAKLRWSNPIRPGTHGDLFVWTHKGRGVLVGSIFSYPSGGQRRVAHQFHSLSTETIQCVYGNDRSFEIPGPGLEFAPIPGAPKPAARRPLRLTQMRGLSRFFKASGMNKGKTQPLRLLAQPIYRFEGEAMEDDGAIFAFVMGTDPELLLVLSIYPTSNGPAWHYAAARYASDPLQLTLKDQIVWDFDDDPNKQGYLSQHGIDMQPEMPVIQSR